jgi:hypothetical protein
MAEHRHYDLFARNDWITPPEIIVPVREFFNYRIDLDPMSSPAANRFIDARYIFTQGMDGLSKGWFGNIYCNPPWGREGGYNGKGEWSWKVGRHMPTEALKRGWDSIASKESNAAVFCLPASLYDIWLSGFLAEHPSVYAIPRSGRTKFIHPETLEPVPGAPRGALLLLLCDPKTPLGKNAQERFGKIMDKAGFNVSYPYAYVNGTGGKHAAAP